jgi:hypothetical protein
MRRVEAFSDAVFAIAITLLVLDLPFETVREGELSTGSARNGPASRPTSSRSSPSGSPGCTTTCSP